MIGLRTRGGEHGIEYAPRAMAESADLHPFDRANLVDQILLLSGQGGTPEERLLRGRLERFAERSSEEDFQRFVQHLLVTGTAWDYTPPDPLARELSRLVNGVLLEPGSGVEGARNLERARERRVILLANHLAFVDANALDVLLSQAGYGDVADRITVLVGPKVFTKPLRRIASLCFGTIKIPQSQARASGAAVMPAREVARIAAGTISTAHERLAKGDVLLIFVEGTRSRTGSMQRALAGVARYLGAPDTALLPIGISGTERMVPIGIETLHRSRVVARVGRPVDAARLLERCGGKRSLVMDCVGFLIADLLPPAYRGAYAGNGAALEPARKIATGVGR